jgi:hypothetical protein
MSVEIVDNLARLKTGVKDEAIFPIRKMGDIGVFVKW